MELKNQKNAIAWILVGLLALALGGTGFVMNQQIQQKESELAALRSQYDQLAAESAKKLEAANNRIKELDADAKEKLAAAKEQIESANQTIESAKQAIESASLKETEVRVAFRKAILSSGKVAGITNVSTQTAAFTVVIKRPANGNATRYELTLDPNQTKEIGAREGWAFVAGDTIEVGQPEHKARTFTVD